MVPDFVLSTILAYFGVRLTSYCLAMLRVERALEEINKAHIVLIPKIMEACTYPNVNIEDVFVAEVWACEQEADLLLTLGFDVFKLKAIR
ncbi:hypothetical protein J1N35_037945 [Gossypium stocksii]|uniref:Uncharacterized protein n=1 Tax=Gossypium stocksii TaxID=47602 RepID=A0A9D3ZLE4_9ROSI|nr:hypothetical protein J1N35_037945 [Gossypium stocksii]